MKVIGLEPTLDIHTSLSKKINELRRINDIVSLTIGSSIYRQHSLLQKSVKLNSSLGLYAAHDVQKTLYPLKNYDRWLLPFSSRISEISKQMETMSKGMVGLSSLGFTSSLLSRVEDIKRQTIPNFSKTLSSLASISQQQVGLGKILPNYLSNSFELYLRQYPGTEKSEIDGIVEDLDQVGEILENISESRSIAPKDIEILNAKLRKREATTFIYFVMQIVLAILLSLTTENSQHPDINITINNENKEEIVKGFSKTLDILSIETRKAKTNVNLRSKPSSNSPKIGLVQKGQMVVVQDIQHKWLRIVYQDDKHTIQSGWVFKKYFEKIK